jgi:hypothetical protein
MKAASDSTRPARSGRYRRLTKRGLPVGEERAITAKPQHRSVARRSIRDWGLFRGNAAAVGPKLLDRTLRQAGYDAFGLRRQRHLDGDELGLAD